MNRTVSKILLGVFILHIITIAFILSTRNPGDIYLLDEEDTPVNAFSFDNPDLADKILTELDIFEPVDESYFNNMNPPHNLYSQPYMGLTQDDNYCKRVRSYMVKNPEVIFGKQRFFTDYGYLSITRKLMWKTGTDMMIKMNRYWPEDVKKSRSFDIKLGVQNFFILGALHLYQHIGKNFACLNQMYNHIPGHATINRKDLIAASMIEYSKQYKDLPQCFTFEKFFPQTWLLQNQDECLDFFENHLNTEKYQALQKKQGIVYIRKLGEGPHQGKGVQVVNKNEETKIREMYENGTLCGQISENRIIQRFIPNPLLLYGHKFDFRMYMFVASTNPLIVYYHDGFLRVSLHKYNINSTEKGVFLTNTELSKQLFLKARGGNKVNNMTEKELKDFQMWTLERFQNYMIEKKIIKDPNWLDNYLRPEFKKAYVHLSRAAAPAFLKRSQIFELMALDFMLDEDLNLWFIEGNTRPLLQGTSKAKGDLIRKMVGDLLEIVTGLTRSRMKRVAIMVNKLSAKISSTFLGEEDLSPLKYRIEDFKEITMNYFEPEYEPKPGNTFHPIVNEHFTGSERYAGILPDECL